MPERAARTARMAFLTSRINDWLSIPLLVPDGRGKPLPHVWEIVVWCYQQKKRPALKPAWLILRGSLENQFATEQQSTTSDPVIGEVR
jgi:hypothetical protein